MTHRIEEHDPDSVVRADEDLLLHDLHSRLERNHEVARLHAVFIPLVLAHLEHGGRAVDAEQDHVPLAFIELPRADGFVCMSAMLAIRIHEVEGRAYRRILQLLIFLVVCLVPIVVRRHLEFKELIVSCVLETRLQMVARISESVADKKSCAEVSM